MNFKLHLHTGPGNHAHLLEQALAANNLGYSFTKYWPTFRFGTREAGREPVTKSTSFLFDKLTFLLWGIWHRLPFLNTNQGHLDILYRYYDLLAASFLPKVDVLLAWSQVSLFTMQKAKKQGAIVILEHPMVHVNTWMHLMREEYARNGPQKGLKYSLFTDRMVKRMLAEYEAADYINVVSSYARKTFIQNGVPARKLILTSLGIDTDFFRPAELVSDNRKFKVLFVGRLELLKGVHFLLEAFAALHLPNTELLLVGRRLPEMQPFLDKYAGTYTYLGPKSPEELRTIYQEASVLVLPSVQESFGLVLTEAMACGVPVISTENTGGPDIITSGQNGYLVPIRNVAAIQEKIVEIYNLRNSLLSFRENARQRVLEKFSSASYAAGIRNLFIQTARLDECS
ncbi:MAG: glycosyl transferase group 1 [Adhaeribacter sp.]|nr:glycosyl transferase group 1 [Adhaeribacter sp.]